MSDSDSGPLFNKKDGKTKPRHIHSTKFSKLVSISKIRFPKNYFQIIANLLNFVIKLAQIKTDRTKKQNDYYSSFSETCFIKISFIIEVVVLATIGA